MTGPDPDGVGGQAAPVTSYAYDDNNQMTSVTDALGAITEYIYDALGRTVEVREPDPDAGGPQKSAVWQYRYDQHGQVIAEIDPVGGLTTYAYDKLGRQILSYDPRGTTTGTTYTNHGNVASLTDASGNVTSWKYDALDRTIERIDPRGKSTTYDYDAASRMTEMVDRLGRKTAYVYDNLDRLITETWLTPDGSGGFTTDNVITADYDVASQLTSIEDGWSQYAYTYDGAGRVATVDNAGNPLGMARTVLTSTYDLAGYRTSLSAGDPGGLADFVNTYSYDDAGRMTQVTQAGQAGGRAVAEKRVDLTYDLLERFDTISRFEDLAGTELVATTDYGFDLAGRLTGLTHASGTSTIADYAYGYDADRLVSATIPKPAGADQFTYSYDQSGQLTGVTKNGVVTESNSYDATGNRAAPEIENGTDHRLLDDGTYTYQYDDEGNRIRRTEKATGDFLVYRWDHRNRLTAVVSRDASNAVKWVIYYRYDTFDRLVARWHDTDYGQAGIEEQEYYIYDSAPGKGGLDDIVLTFNENEDVLHRYLHGPAIDQIFSDESTVDGLLWALSDRQGSVRDWAKYDGTTDTTSVYNHVEFDSFGKITSQANANHEVTTGYTGRYTDPVTKLQNNRRRWYDPLTRIWTSQDPEKLRAGDVNLYRFVGNAPTNFVDPSELLDRLRPAGPNAWRMNRWNSPATKIRRTRSVGETLSCR